ncbi:hypothetical protein FJZ53_03080 [Candidatus Woesearchaeota archaeon]|nr:hypothetical protein [Candidatus Woesearchaeota archaeon]
MDDNWFAKFKDKDRYVIKQKIITDGGQLGKLDGEAGRIEVKIITKTADDWILDISYQPEPNKEETEKAYSNLVDEMLKD